MAYAEANGAAVLDARVSIPRVGVWHADVATEDASGGLSGRVTLSLNGFELVGTARRSGVALDTSMARVVGGAGGLPKPVQPRQYRNMPLRSVLSDILSAAGEKLSSSADGVLLGTFLPFWTVRAGSAAAALTSLLGEVVGAVWRVLVDGSVWVGFESWPSSPLQSFDLLRPDPLADKETFYAEVPNVLPGTAFDGRRVSYVEHVITEGSIRSSVWFEAIQ